MVRLSTSASLLVALISSAYLPPILASAPASVSVVSVSLANMNTSALASASWLTVPAAVASSATPYTKVMSHSGCSSAKRSQQVCRPLARVFGLVLRRAPDHQADVFGAALAPAAGQRQRSQRGPRQGQRRRGSCFCASGIPPSCLCFQSPESVSYCFVNSNYRPPTGECQAKNAQKRAFREPCTRRAAKSWAV